MPGVKRGVSRWIRFGVGLPILLLAAAVRLLGLGNQDLWGDEAFSVMTALGGIRGLLASLTVGEPHPPLYPLLLAGWLRVAGHSELVARLPSALAGVAAVAIAMALARYLAPEDERSRVIAAVVAGLLVALSPFQLWYSQEARMYEQLSAFAGLATLGLLRLWKGRRGSVPLYVVALLGVTGSHYYGLFVPLAHGIAVVRTGRKTPGLLPRWLGASSVAGLLYLPWVILARHIFFGYTQAAPGTVDLPHLALSAWVRVAAGWSLSWDHAAAAAAILTIFVALGLFLPGRGAMDCFPRVVLAAWLFTPFVGGYLVSILRPMYAERYLAVSSLPLILLVARSISSGLVAAGSPRVGEVVGGGGRLRNSGVRPLASLAMLGVALGLGLGASWNVWNGRYVKSTYDTHVQDVAALFRTGDAVILDGTSQWPLYDYYLPKPWPTYGLPEQLPLDAARTDATLGQIAATHQGVWIFLYATRDYDPSYLIPSWLTANGYRAFDDWAVSGRLQYYRFAPQTALAARPTSLSFGTSLALDRYAWLDLPLAAGGSIPLDLSWRRLATPLPRGEIGLRLVDASGFTWAQADEPLGGDFVDPSLWSPGSFDDHHGLLVPPGTPPGDYQLLLNVYGAGDGKILPVAGEGAPILPGGVNLATIHVTSPSQSVWAAGIGGYHPVGKTFGNEIALRGWAGSERVTAGASGYVTLIWQAIADHPSTNAVRLSLRDVTGKIVQSRDLPLATASYPPARWKSSDVLREQYRLAISDHLSAGTYDLLALPLAPDGSASSDAVVLGKLNVEAGAAPAAVAPPSHPLDATLGGKAALVGYDLGGGPWRAGSNVRLTLHWKDTAPFDSDYTVFVHVLNSSERVVAQHDQPPGGGARPTSSWFEGDEIVDQYQLTLPSDLPPGEYPVEVGLYNPSSGHRLPVALRGKPAGDRIIVTTLEVTR